MNSMLRAALISALAIASVPVIAEGQERSAADLVRRIEQLERSNADLERRVRELEALGKTTPSKAQPGPASGNWRDLANWRRLRKGMSVEDVRLLLGEPDRVESAVFTYWYWAGADVHFYDEKLYGWSEPRR